MGLDLIFRLTLAKCWLTSGMPVWCPLYVSSVIRSGRRFLNCSNSSTESCFPVLGVITGSDIVGRDSNVGLDDNDIFEI